MRKLSYILTLLLTTACLSLSAQVDIRVSPYLADKYVKTNEAMEMSVALYNVGEEEIVGDIEVAWRLGEDGERNTRVVSFTGFLPGYQTSQPIVISPSLTLTEEGPHQVYYSVSLLGMEEAEAQLGNNEFVVDMIAMDNPFPMIPLVEKVTGTWCPPCAGGARALEYMAEQGVEFVAFDIHTGDQLTTQDGQQWNSAYNDNNGVPAATVNRTFLGETFSNSPTQWIGLTQTFQSAPATVDFMIDYDEASRTVTIDAAGEFAIDMEGDFRLNAVVLENNINGDRGTPYEQRNAYNGATQLANDPVFGPLVGAGNPLNEWTHNHVFREALGGIRGIDEAVPNMVTKGETFSYTFEYTVPESYVPENLEFAVILTHEGGDKSSNEVLNSVAHKIGEGVSMKELIENYTVTVYPNPTPGIFTVDYTIKEAADVNFNLVNVAGQTARSYNEVNVNAGPNQLHIDANDVPSGVYFLNIEAGGQRITKKVVVMD